MKEYIKAVEDCNLALTVVPEELKKKAKEEAKRKAKELQKRGKPAVEDELEAIATNPLLTPELQVKTYKRRAFAYIELDEPEKGI